jgi:hypothetical protein
VIELASPCRCDNIIGDQAARFFAISISAATMQRILFALATFILPLLVPPALAHDPTGQWSNSPHHAWFANAANKLGEPCCAKSDAHVLENGDWRMTRNGYQARVGASWYSIDQSQLVFGNPTGHAVLWYTPTTRGPVISCFSPGSEY